MPDRLFRVRFRLEADAPRIICPVPILKAPTGFHDECPTKYMQSALFFS